MNFLDPTVLLGAILSIALLFGPYIAWLIQNKRQPVAGHQPKSRDLGGQ
jgi:uncharacterized Tic20 family protein